MSRKWGIDDSLRRSGGRDDKTGESWGKPMFSEAKSPVTDSRLTSDFVEHSVTDGRVMRGGERR